MRTASFFSRRPSIMNKEDRKKIVCSGPKYPGSPEDYILVEACRKKKSTDVPRGRSESVAKQIDAYIKKLNKKLLIDSAKAREVLLSQLEDKTDEEVKILRFARLMDEMPSYILFMVETMKDFLKQSSDTILDLDAIFKKANLLWPGNRYISNNRMKYCVFSLIRT